MTNAAHNLSGTNTFFRATLAESDPEMASAIGKEFGRQQHRSTEGTLIGFGALRLCARCAGIGLHASVGPISGCSSDLWRGAT